MTGMPPGAARDAVADALSAALADVDLPGRRTIWTAAPTSLLGITTIERATPRPWTPWSSTAASLATITSRRRGARLMAVGEVLFAYEGSNPAATLEPVISALSRSLSLEPHPLAVRPSPSVLLDELTSARRAATALADCLPMGLPSSIEAALYAAARSRARAANAIHVARPRLLVVASQHSTTSRAFLRLAHERGTTTAYLPHAPVADTHTYRDLPVHAAGLRGSREVDFYRALGVSGPLTVIGNPQVEVRPPASLDGGGPIVFAPSPRSRAALAAQVVALHGRRVIVSPHPRMAGHPDYETLWPSDWTVHQGRTVDLFDGRSPCVVQSSSGVAWEALAHGIPVVDVTSVDGASAAYPLIAPPHVLSCTVERLTDTVDAAVARASDEGWRGAAMGWAGEWSSPNGPEAVDRAVRWITTLLDEPPSGLLLDRWGGG